MEHNDIIKALECCITNSEMDCINCPYRGIVNDLYDGCVNTLVKDALSLIKELTEENERLKAENETLEIYNADYKYKNKELTAFNRRWAKECAELQDECEYIKADTVREMQERLKYTLCINNEENYEIFDYAYTLETIDQIAKEMLDNDNT